MARSVQYVYYLRDFFTRNARAMAAAAKKVAGSTRAAAAGMALLGAAITVAGGYALGKMIKAYANFEEVLINVKKVLPNAVEQWDHVKNAIKRVGTEVPLAREQIAKFFEEAVRGGVADPSDGPIKSVEKWAKFSKLAANTSFLFNMQASKTAPILARMKTALGLTLPEMKGFLQQINILGDTMSTNESNVLEVVRRVGGLVQSTASGASKDKMVALMKSQREGLAAAGAVLTASNVQDNVAATGLRNLMLRVGRGKYANKNVLAGLKMARINPGHFANLLATDFLSAVELMFEKVSKLKDPAKRNAAMAQILGLKSVDAFAPAFTNFKNLFKQARDLTADVARRQARWATGMKIKYESINARLSMMGNALRDLRDGFVVEWVDEIKWAADGIRDMAVALDKMPTFKRFAGGLIAAILVIGSFILVAGLLAMSLSALGVTAAGVGAALGLAFGPVGATIAVLAGGAWLLYDNWDAVSGGLKAIWNDLQSAAQAFADSLSTIWDKVTNWKKAYGKNETGREAARKSREALNNPYTKEKLEYHRRMKERYGIALPEWAKKPTSGPSVPSVPPSQGVVDSMAKRVKIENQVKSDVHVTSDVNLTAPSSIAVKVNGQIGGHIPLGTSASRGQNMSTSTTGQTVSE